jgi:predicted nucleic acid-binding Zn ribbon protein
MVPWWWANFWAMATYIYETIPGKKGQKPRRFEVEQKMTDAPLMKDPETGLPVRRVITGGSGLVTRGTSILSMNRPKRR